MILADDKQKILKEIFGEPRRSGDELLYYCKFCGHHKKKLSINISKDSFKCWICGRASTSILPLIKKFGTRDHVSAWSDNEERVDLSDIEGYLNHIENNHYDEPETIVELPKQFIPLANSNSSLTVLPALRYLYNRNVLKDDILKWKMGCCVSGDYAGRIVIPSFNRDGNCNFFVARTYEGAFPSYKNSEANKKVIFNELFLDWEQDIILVEGIFDAIVAGNAIPLLGNSLSENSRFFEEVMKHDTRVFLALDTDAEKMSEQLIQKMIEYGVEVYKIPLWGFKDPGSMTKEEFRKRKEQAILINADTIVEYEVSNA